MEIHLTSGWRNSRLHICCGALVVAALLCAAPSATPLASSGDAEEQTATVVSVTLSPTTIAGGSGSTSTATVTLSAPAPAGGAIVTLASSNIELAATMPSVTVPQGATSATFTVATNEGYRRYSNLAFSAAISATHAGSTRSATLNVTAQPRPPDFNSGSTAGANTQWDGLMCGGIAPIGGYPGILYDCSPADASGFGSCTFRQECSLGCRRVPPSGGHFNDFCSTGGPNPVAISRNSIVSGDRVPASIVLEAPAGNAQDQEQAVPGVIDPNFNSMEFPVTSFSIPDGATTGPFEVATSYVPAIQWVEVGGFWFNASIPPFLITNGRSGSRWLVMVPPNPAPAVAIPTLGNFTMTGLNPVTGDQGSFGSVDLSGLSRVGGPTLTLTSSHPDIVPSKTMDAPASENLFGFQLFFDTRDPPADTNVTVTVSDGRYSFSDVITVRKAPPPPLLADLSVNPTSVVGGNSATGTVTLSRTQTGPTVVSISTGVSSSVATMPSSVTVPAGATTANFTINTAPRTSQFNLNIFADLAGSPSQQALLIITAGGGGGTANPQALTITPDSVVGGRPATGTVTLTSSAPAGGAVVTLSKAFSTPGPGTVPATIPASVTVPAGQTSASFAINTSAVTAATNVRISATRNSVTVNADVTLFPLFNSVMFSGTVPGGSPAIGDVFLNGPAPTGGTVVSLSSGNTSLVTVPASVTVPAGQTTATFTANTQPVTQFTAVPITASAAGTTVQANLFLAVSQAVASVTLSPSTVVGPASLTGTVRLRSAGRAVVDLVSSNTVLATVPFSVVVPDGQTSATFTVNAAQVTQTSTVVISATHENVTQSATLTINPSGGSTGPTLSALSLNPTSVTGGSSSTGTVTLSGAAPSGGAAVSLSDNSSAAATPASVTVPAGATSATFSVTTTSVTSTTTATISGVYGGVTRTASLGVNPSSAPAAPTLVSPANDATGVAQPVTLDWNNVTGAASYEVQVDNSSTIASPFVANSTVTSSQATLSGLPAQQLWWRVRARNAAGVAGPFSSTRRFTPQGATGPAALSAVSVSPSSVVGGSSSTGTLTLTSAAPTGGAVVSLSSSNAAAANVPASVTIAAGAASATFPATTSAVTTSTPVTISAVYAGITRTATLTVNPAGQTATLTVTATGRSGERVMSSPAGVNVNVGTTGSASFNTGTSITLSVTNGRDAIWSGACSSGGDKRRTCTFTLNGNASVTANVQ
jgi:hypothetical protein